MKKNGKSILGVFVEIIFLIKTKKNFSLKKIYDGKKRVKQHYKERDRNAGYMNRICDFTPVVTQQRPPFTTHTRCRLLFFFLVV